MTTTDAIAPTIIIFKETEIKMVLALSLSLSLFFLFGYSVCCVSILPFFQLYYVCMFKYILIAKSPITKCCVLKVKFCQVKNALRVKRIWCEWMLILKNSWAHLNLYIYLYVCVCEEVKFVLLPSFDSLETCAYAFIHNISVLHITLGNTFTPTTSNHV